MIALRINGKRIELAQPTPLLAYLEQLGVNPRAVAVEHNSVIVERDQYASIVFQDDDTVEIVRMVGGGLSVPSRKFDGNARGGAAQRPWHPAGSSG